MPYQDTTLTPKQVAGNAAEAMASAYLEQAGLHILTRNYRVRGGEIDCIALDGRTSTKTSVWPSRAMQSISPPRTR